MQISELEEICIDVAKGVYGGHTAWQMDTARKQSVKEHEIIRKALEMLHLEDVIDGKESEVYHEEYQVEYFVADFYVPKANLIIEINSKQHFYPYTYKKDQVTNFKTKLLRCNSQASPDAHDYSVINLNVQMLEGMKNDIPKVSDFLRKIIMNKIS